MGEHNHNHHGHSHHHHGDGNIKVAFFLNLGFTIIEIFGGIFTNSVAILSDALHDLGDTFSLGLAWYFQRLSKKGRDQTFSYGYKRFSLIGAIVNSIILIIGSIFILTEAIPRLMNPQTTNALGMIGLAVLGVIVNGAAVLRLRTGTSVNERVVSLHLLEDVLGWVAVLVGATMMYFFDLPIIDPILSVLIAIFILKNVFKSLRQSFKIILQAIPEDVNADKVTFYLIGLSAVQSIHDLHIWSMDGEYNVLSVHLVLEKEMNSEELHDLKTAIRHELQHLNIEHSTFEMEITGEECEMEDC